MDYIRVNDQLQDTVSHAGDHTCFQPEPVAGKADEEHGKQGNGTAERKFVELQIGQHAAQGNGHGTEGQLLGAQL